MGAQHDLPERIQLVREEYRGVVAALEGALEALESWPAGDPTGDLRRHLESVIHVLAIKIWPELGELDAGG